MADKSRLTKIWDRYSGEIVFSGILILLVWGLNLKFDGLQADINAGREEVQELGQSLDDHSATFNRLKHLFVEVHPDVARALLAVAAPDVPDELELEPQQARELVYFLEGQPWPSNIFTVEQLRAAILGETDLSEAQADFFGSRYMMFADFDVTQGVEPKQVEDVFTALESFPNYYPQYDPIYVAAMSRPSEPSLVEMLLTIEGLIFLLVVAMIVLLLVDVMIGTFRD